jgi:pimeloyl-ACP methyl ester carboxylesterase
MAQSNTSRPVKNVVLVHGAFADGSSWSKVIPLLGAKGLQVTCVAIPLTSFAQDLTNEEKALLVAVQPQTAGSIFNAKPTSAAWREKPTWYIVAGNDRMIAPEQEKSMAKQMNATTAVISSSHVVMLAQPTKVAEVIEEAVSGGAKR